MARRRKPIDFKAIKDGNRDELKRAITDLLRKYPTGPSGNLKQEDYCTMVRHGDVELHEYKIKKLGLREKEAHGYTMSQIWCIFEKMGIVGDTTGEWDLRWALERILECGKAGYTRKSRRLARGYSHLYSQEFKSGRLGDMIFSLRMDVDPAGYDMNCRDVKVVAMNDSEAMQIGKVMFGHISTPRYANFVKRGGPEVLVNENKKCIEFVDTKIQGFKKEAEHLAKKIFLLETHKEAIELYNINAFAE